MRLQYLLLLIVLLVPGQALPQEALVPLQFNPKKSQKALETHRLDAKDLASPLALPFWDDFSYPGPYPDPDIWADDDVYVNSGFAVHPKTWGVATFDIIDAQGKIHENASIDNIPFAADKLTSRPIDLDDFSPSDSLILSFYYQPQGRGGEPATSDSLVLQFSLPAGENEQNGEDADENMWQSVWMARGESLKSFARDTFPYFKRVAIPITDEQYFRDDFSFRFRNYASFTPGQTIPNYTATGNIWNIDYVYLNSNRSVLDSAYYDIAFAAPAQSILKDLAAIPWSHYIADPQSLLRTSFDVRISNLDVNTYNYSYRYIIQDEGDNTIRTYSGGSWVIAPFFTEGYQDYPPHSNPIVLSNPLPTAPATQRQFRLLHALREGATGDAFTRNDTIVYHQVFSNYFAYDNGSPQMAHLVKGYSPARAMQFTARHPDTLEAVQIYFMETINNQDHQQAFELVVFSSLEPEEVLYRSDPLFSPETGRNNFVTFSLDQEVLVEESFYVGIQQNSHVELGNSLVIGFDLENDASHRLYNHYGDGEGWQASTKQGALMIRPVMKRDDITGIPPEQAMQPRVAVYPNPLSGSLLHIRLNTAGLEQHETQIQVFDIQGRRLYTGPFSPTLDVTRFNNGIYLLRINNIPQGINQTTRFIISR